MHYTNIGDFVERFKLEHPKADLSFGSSAILLFDGGVIFSLVKQKHWRQGADGKIVIDYSGVGGGIENGETPLQALKREIMEEIGLDDSMYEIITLPNTFYVGHDGLRSEATLTGDDKSPCVLGETKITQKHLREGQPALSYLLLFIYLVKIKGSQTPRISENEEIPGLLYVDGDYLEHFLNEQSLSSQPDDQNKYRLMIQDKYRDAIPENFMLQPKFTPVAFKNSGLKYDQIIKYC